MLLHSPLCLFSVAPQFATFAQCFCIVLYVCPTSMHPAASCKDTLREFDGFFSGSTQQWLRKWTSKTSGHLPPLLGASKLTPFLLATSPQIHAAHPWISHSLPCASSTSPGSVSFASPASPGTTTYPYHTRVFFRKPQSWLGRAKRGCKSQSPNSPPPRPQGAWPVNSKALKRFPSSEHLNKIKLSHQFDLLKGSGENNI